MALVVLAQHNLLVFIMFLLININIPPSVTPLSLNYPKFDGGYQRSESCSNVMGTICLDGDASVDSESKIQLTKSLGENSVYSVGRAYYSQPLHLWDNTSTGNLLITNFTTNFSFCITNATSKAQQQIGDGIAFFLCPYPSRRIPINSQGGSLGLVTNTSIMFDATGDSSFVAVEFDTYQNIWDPSPLHIGIDVNSMKSKVNRSLNVNSDTHSCLATVDYNSVTQNLSVYLICDRDAYYVDYKVDLSLVLPDFVAFGFSGSTGQVMELNKIESWSFRSTLDDILDARVNPPINKTIFISPEAAPPYPPRNEQGKKNKSRIAVLVIVVAVIAVVLGVLCLISLVVWRFKSPQGEEGPDDERPLSGRNEENNVHIKKKHDRVEPPRKFNFRHIVKATDNFSEKNILGKGGYGAVYKGFLKDVGRDVAIKKIDDKNNVERGKKAWNSEIKSIGQLHHRNLVRLLGWSDKGGVFVLVYELMSNGSLDHHLYQPGRVLAWNVRYQIARGVASALAYMHEDGDRYIVHRDLKPSNILLDDRFGAKLGDFGFAKLADHNSSLEKTRIVGTPGYFAPEYTTIGKASKESDVYSFGVVALEIATGRRPGGDHGTDLIKWVRDLSGQGNILKAADGNLNRDFNEEEINILLKVGLLCAHENAKDRPSMKDVVLYFDRRIDVNTILP